MRNIFDQYSQPENKLTHALVVTLSQTPTLLRPFLQWIGVQNVPPTKLLLICEQQVPGFPTSDLDEEESKGLPDACVYTEDGWAVFFECKVQSQISIDQIQRHKATAIRYGFQSPHIVVIAADQPKFAINKQATVILWKDLYYWFSQRCHESRWVAELVQYMQTLERKMIAQEYLKKGTITVFDGLRFDSDNPYTYREGKRLIRLLGDELQKRKDLHAIGVDPSGKRLTAIRGRDRDHVWDFLPLVAARSAKEFTSFPHLTMVLRSYAASAAVVVPNGVKGGFRSKLVAGGLDGFKAILVKLEMRLRPIIEKHGAKPMAYVAQRHKTSRSSPFIVDARLDADLRTMIPDALDGVRFQPEWIDAIFNVLAKKRSNMQFGIDVTFPYSCPAIRDERAMEIFAKTWVALSPLLNFVLKD